MIKTNLHAILEREMDRRDFLKYMGIAMLALIGINRILSVFTSEAVEKHKDVRSSGYGMSPYGR